MALGSTIQPFFWGSNGQRLTPEEIAEQQRYAQDLAAQAMDTSPVGHWSAALNRGLQGALAGYDRRQARLAGQENAADSKRLSEALLGAMGGGSSFPSVSAPVASALTGGGQSYTPNGDQLRDGIIQTAEAIGADPLDLATAISYETAGTFDPTKAGPTTQWGQHRGLIQFGEPQARQHGVDWNDPLGSQLGPNGAVASYFRASGFKPGMSGLDLYSTINAGAPGRYGASDANNGGAPGDVRDKWENQMSGHRQKAMALLGRGAEQQPQAAPVQVASTDPSAGVAAAFNGADAGSPGVSVVYDPATGRTITGPGNIEPPRGQPGTVPYSGPGANAAAPGGALTYDPASRSAAQLPTPSPTAVAALTGQPAQAPSPQPVQVAQSGGINPAVIEALTSPYVSEGTRALAQALLGQHQGQQKAAQDERNWYARQQWQQQQQQADPAYQLDMDYRRAQIEKMQRDAANPAGDENFFGNPIATQNPDGSVSYGQIGNKGSFRPIQLPEGQTFAPPTRTINTGTENILMDQAGNVISRTPINNREQASETAAGTVEGRTAAERAASADGDYQSAQNALALIDDIRNDPARQGATGKSSLFNAIPGTAGYSFNLKVEQAKSGAFLTAIQQMKGMGALSNAEGAAATAAVTRLNTADTEEGFLAALDDYEKIVRQALDRAGSQLPGRQPAAAAPAQRLRFNPQTGDFE